MTEITGDLWSYWDQPDSVVCVTTNGIVSTSGNLVMGRGCAFEATQRYPGIARALGTQVLRYGNVPVFIANAEHRLCSFPTKAHWRDRSSILLIKKSAERMIDIMGRNPGYNWILPRPGCGNGQLAWDDVRPVIEFLPDNVLVIGE